MLRLRCSSLAWYPFPGLASVLLCSVPVRHTGMLRDIRCCHAALVSYGTSIHRHCLLAGWRQRRKLERRRRRRKEWSQHQSGTHTGPSACRPAPAPSIAWRVPYCKARSELVPYPSQHVQMREFERRRRSARPTALGEDSQRPTETAQRMRSKVLRHAACNAPPHHL